jgi:wyosine [tRNA(Phe)-imidazoG37] synthetase (radical SAM superfamily)
MPRKKKSRALLGYYIGQGSQQFGSGRCYRCVYCQLVQKGQHAAETHEATCPKRLESKRRATMLGKAGRV